MSLQTGLLLTSLILVCAVAWGESAARETGGPRRYYGKLLPVPFTDVTVEDEFWAPRLRINRERTLPHNLALCEETGRIRNFAQAAGLDDSPYQGHYFHDSDVYKVLEGAAYCLATNPDPALEAEVDRIVGLIAAAQQADGYLNTWHTIKEPEARWTDLRAKHELYTAGHLFEAAVAHYEATGKRSLLDVACGLADHIDGIFGPGKRHDVPGHEEIELALVKLWRVTGEGRYLRLARFFVDEHGRADTHELFGTYCQDHQPIREQTEAVGHCVRAMYLYCAVADLAALTGDEGYGRALEALWRDVERKMYVTGGIGVQGHGEGFAAPYFLPNDEAYCETCAAIGMALWNHRLALLRGEGRFADIVELELYNGALAGVSLDGTSFFYVNPLASRGTHHRQRWYGCACCPTNVVRFLAPLGGYIYARSAEGDGVWVLQYIGGTGKVPVGDGEVLVRQETRYPWDGQVRVTVEPRGAQRFPLHLRVPAWCEGATVAVNGRPVSDLAPADGFVTLDRAWKPGDVVELSLPMPVLRVRADPRVEDDRGRLALLRGPVIYCLEDCDNAQAAGGLALAKDTAVRAEPKPDLLGGVVVLRGRGRAGRITEAEDGSLAYEERAAELTAVPYYAWDNREPGQMVVWVPAELDARRDLSGLTVAVLARASASHCHPTDSVAALKDGVLPSRSIDHSIPRFTWWDHRGTTEWVQYDFDEPRTFAKAEVYWFDDTGRGQCRVPASWRVLWRDGDQWRPVQAAGAHGVERDQFNVVTFEPVTTDALRIEVQLQEGFSGGILEWRLPR